MPNRDLIAEIQDLTGAVSSLETELSKNKGVIKRLRLLAICLVGLLVFVGGYVSVQTNHNKQRAEENAHNAIVNCENANQSREANRRIWTLVIDQTRQNPDRTLKDIENTQAFQKYINLMYRQHDCNDLDRRYPIPDPPKFRF